MKFMNKEEIKSKIKNKQVFGLNFLLDYLFYGCFLADSNKIRKIIICNFKRHCFYYISTFFIFL